MTHSLKYRFYSSSGISNLLEIVADVSVDEVQAFHYDTNTRKCELRQEWMKKASEDDPEFWLEQTEDVKRNQHIFKTNIKTLRKHLNQTDGIHDFQWIHGCDWSEPNEVKGYNRIGYDGEDLFSFDLETEKWNVSNSFIIQKDWDYDKDLIPLRKHYLTEVCRERLEKYQNFGRSSLMRTELPSVSLLQKTLSSPVRCFASGFYPERASLTWRKDGVKLLEGVKYREILPNHDGTFQMSADLINSSVATRNLGRYECVFGPSGLMKDVVTKLDTTAIRSNWDMSSALTTNWRATETGGERTHTAAITAALTAVAICIFIVFWFILKKFHRPHLNR